MCDPTPDYTYTYTPLVVRPKHQLPAVRSDASSPRPQRQCNSCFILNRACNGESPRCGQCISLRLECAYEHIADHSLKANEPETSILRKSRSTTASPLMITKTTHALLPPRRDVPAAISQDNEDFYEDQNVKFLGSMATLTQTAAPTPTPLLQYSFLDPASRPRLQNFQQKDADALRKYDSVSSIDQYTYVNIQPSQIRLLLLSKGLWSDTIHCSLMCVNAEELKQPGLVYQALSYHWGKETECVDSIFIRDMDAPMNGNSEKGTQEQFVAAARQLIPRSMRVQKNLFQALRRLRSPSEDLWLWVDALCINQSNRVEKTHQLAKMIDVYSHACNVLIWIGEHEPVQDAEHPNCSAMDFIPRIVDLVAFDGLTSGRVVDESTAQFCRAFAQLLRRPWFSRRWVIQEVSAARHATVLCGDQTLNWIDFSDAVELFISNINSIRILYSRTDVARQDPDALHHVEALGAKAIVSGTANVLRKAQNGLVVDRPSDIETLVMTFLHFDVSDPRDTVYALLGLASDGHYSLAGSKQGPSLHPDYSKSASQVYMEFVRHCVVSRGSLDIICRHWAIPVSPTTHLQSSAVSMPPSWVGMVSASAFGPSSSRLTGRCNGDSLVGLPGQAAYNASRGSHMVVQFGKRKLPARNDCFEMNGILRVAGISIGKVCRATSRVVDGTISDECLELLGWRQGDNVNDLLDHLWRVLVGDRDAHGRSPPAWYRRACMYCLAQTTAEGDLSTKKLLANPSLPATVRQFLQRVESVTWSRKFLLCEALGGEPTSPLLGFGSRRAKEGDVVCILFGCSVPVLLRRARASHEYILIGECYIHGRMDGESIPVSGSQAAAVATNVYDLI